MARLPQDLLVTTFALLSTGTILFMHIEGFNAVDAFYFTGVTLSTVGYGDIVPATKVNRPP